MTTIKTLPHLPNEIIDYINKIAKEMEVAENRELHRAVRFNSCMKWIEYIREDYEIMLTDSHELEDEYSFRQYLDDEVDLFVNINHYPNNF